MSSIVLFRKEFNPATVRGSGCMLNSYPPRCESEIDIECIRGESAKKTGRIYGLILLISLVCLFLLLASITCHVCVIERSLSSSPRTLQSSNNQNDEPQSSNKPHVEEDFGEDECPATRDAENVEEPKEKESLTRSALKQSLLYIVAFIITFAPNVSALFISLEVADSKYGTAVLWLNSTIFPIYGIFLILIYTRPKVQILSKMFPKASWFLCFKVVLGSGGDVPPAHELKPSHLPRMSGEEFPEDSQRASMPGDVSYEEMKSNMMAVSKSEGWSNVIDVSEYRSTM
ncbi:predicted protein [Chaetoceros tenuissimus]|uniref:Uncharacterized protein n=1 Tax=Chaetoceros tenuissimus TaxID=426638 RepID=A0AAD3GYJ1_9STRA|nr:predicted protein [Chaetoceros tenuissimus]